MNKNVLSILIFALVGIAASIFIPWVKAAGLSVSGDKGGDGYISAGFLAVPLIISIISLKSSGIGTGAFIGILIPALLASGVGILNIYDISSKGISLNPFGDEFAVIGSGLYLLVLSGLFIAIRAFGARNKA
jgi:hypothetical protein